jgi:putative membrane protein
MGNAGPEATDADATRRTVLAVERTELAWWRTGLTALAVAVGVGRIAPEVDTGGEEWPYAVLGVAFSLYGVALFAFARSRTEEAKRALGAVGVVLSVATALLILLA